MNFFVPFIVTLCIALFTTPLMIKLANKLNIIDSPTTPLKTHSLPTPYLGGIALYISLCISTLLFLKIQPWIGLFLTGTGFLCITGLIDDIYQLDPKTKFILQGAGCVTLLISVTAATGITPATPILLLSLLFLFTIVNAVNLVDIMDLLATTIASTSLLGLIGLSFIAHHNNLLLLEIITLGALLGFMWYNKKPAQIYLGDAGSLTLGGILGFLILTHAWKSEFIQDLFAIPLVAGVMLIEIIFLIIIRIKYSIPFYLGSPHHFMHYLKQKNWSWLKILGLTASAGIALNIITIAYKLNYLSFGQLWFIALLGLIPWTMIIYRKQQN